MKNIFYLATISILFSCGNNVEEIKDPTSGVVLIKYEYYTDDLGQKIKDGKYTEWNRDGSLKLDCEYTDGKKEGSEIYFATKDSVIHNTYVAGERSGACLTIVDGVTIQELNFLDGKLNGKQRFYYHNGKLKSEGSMVDYRAVNNWKYYSPEHDHITELNFNENGISKELIGKWSLQRKDGKEEFMLLDKSGAFEYHSPLFKYDRKAIKQLSGVVLFGSQLVLGTRGGNLTYDIRYLYGDTLSLIDKKGIENLFVKDKRYLMMK